MIGRRSRGLGTAGKGCAHGHQPRGKCRVKIKNRHLKACFQQTGGTIGPQISKAYVSVMHDVSLVAETDDPLDLAKIVDAPIGIFAPVARLFIAAKGGGCVPIGIVQIDRARAQLPRHRPRLFK